MFSKNPNKAQNFINNINKLAQKPQAQQQIQPQSSQQTTSQKSVDERVAEGFNYAVNFYNVHPNRTLDEQWQCLAELQNITGLDDDVCAKIQSPILSILQYQETVDIANEAIQNQLRIVTDLLRNRMLELQPTLQTETVNELPHIPKVPSKPTVVNSLDETVKEQIPSDGVYQLVNFSNKELGYKGVEQLLYSDKGVKAMRDGSSNLSDIYQGMAAKQGVMIVQLNLSNCNIGGLGADKLGQAIHSDSGLHSLQYLNLSNNNIDDSGIYSIASNAKGNSTPSLRWLDLSNNLLTDNTANSFHWAFKENKLYNLNYLDVSGNKITNDGDTKLMQAAKGLWRDFAIFTHTLDKIVKMGEGTKEEKIAIYKAIVEKGKVLGTYDKAMVVDKNWFGKMLHMKDEGFLKLKWLFGFGKCKLIPDPKEEVTSYAQDQIIATLPAKTAMGLGIAKKGVGVLTNHYDVVTCFISTTDAVWSSELGQQIAKYELCLAGENDFCHAEQ